MGLYQLYGNYADSAILSSFFSGQFSNAISSEVCGPIDFRFHLRHPGENLYYSYGNYADRAFFAVCSSFVQPNFQMLSCLKFLGQLTSIFMSGMSAASGMWIMGSAVGWDIVMWSCINRCTCVLMITLSWYLICWAVIRHQSISMYEFCQGLVGLNMCELVYGPLYLTVSLAG